MEQFLRKATHTMYLMDFCHYLWLNLYFKQVIKAMNTLICDAFNGSLLSHWFLLILFNDGLEHVKKKIEIDSLFHTRISRDPYNDISYIIYLFSILSNKFVSIYLNVVNTWFKALYLSIGHSCAFLHHIFVLHSFHFVMLQAIWDNIKRYIEEIIQTRMRETLKTGIKYVLQMH